MPFQTPGGGCAVHVGLCRVLDNILEQMEEARRIARRVGQSGHSLLKKGPHEGAGSAPPLQQREHHR